MRLTAVAMVALAAAALAAGKPNVLVIFTDDHGWADCGANGVDKDIRTPHLDQLARDGVRFTRGYVTAPQCVPSRAGLIAGRHQNRFGVDDNLSGPLPLEVLTIPERLRAAGYATGMSGKWHLDLVRDPGQGRRQRPSREFLPHAHGFDEYWCGAMRTYEASHDLSGKALPNAPESISDPRFRIVVQTEAALAFLDRRAKEPDRPWFLYLPWFAPHVPLESPEPWFSRTSPELPLQRRQALAMMAAMDDGLGLIRDKLRAMGAEGNTLIFFIGDNGAPLRPGAWNGSLNLPLVGEKGMLTDGGVRVPFVAAWPGALPAGTVYEHPVTALDVGATAVALAGLPHDAGLDGVDLRPFIRGERQGPPHQTLYWRWRSQAAILEMPWKLVLLGPSERYLFNVASPEGETVSRLQEHPDIAARLEAKLKAWADTLQTTGLPAEVNEQDRSFFTAHVDKTLAPADKDGPPAAAAEVPGSIQGWVCRNGAITVRDGALTISPDAAAGTQARPFITRTGLDLPGPVTAVLTLRGGQGGPSSLAWRTRGQRDFGAAQSVSFDWPGGADWREIRVVLPVEGNLIHLRLNPGPGLEGLGVRSIRLLGAGGAEQAWDFTAGLREGP